MSTTNTSSANRFRFRVWDKTSKMMTTGGSFRTVEINGVDQEVFGVLTPHPDDCELMQATGLRDRSGKEIFEGDVVFVRFHKYVVTWNIERTGFEPFVDYDEDRDIYHDADESEVIGNIWENPELLK